jgi:hypothetical protein
MLAQTDSSSGSNRRDHIITVSAFKEHNRVRSVRSGCQVATRIKVMQLGQTDAACRSVDLNGLRFGGGHTPTHQSNNFQPI